MKYVPTAVTRFAGRAVLRTQKNSPTILFVAGVTGAVTATVLACRATLKAQPVVDNIKKDLIDVEVHLNHKQTNEEEARKMRMHIFMTGGRDLVKLYGPSVGLGVVSLFCLTKSHRQLTQRNATLTAAYVSLQQFLDGYRSRVRKEIGEEREKNVYYASTPVEIIEDGKKGTKSLQGSRPGMAGPYSFIWDERSSTFQDAHDYNLAYIKMAEDFLTNKLRAQGYLWLNDVRKHFDVPITQNGQLCGWMIPHPESDDFVEIKWTPMQDFHQSLMLDFNVGGMVLNMLDDETMSR